MHGGIQSLFPKHRQTTNPFPQPFQPLSPWEILEQHRTKRWLPQSQTASKWGVILCFLCAEAQEGLSTCLLESSKVPAAAQGDSGMAVE